MKKISGAGGFRCMTKVITGKQQIPGVSSSHGLTVGSGSRGLITEMFKFWEIIYARAPKSDGQSRSASGVSQSHSELGRKPHLAPPMAGSCRPSTPRPRSSSAKCGPKYSIISLRKYGSI